MKGRRCDPVQPSVTILEPRVTCKLRILILSLSNRNFQGYVSARIYKMYGGEKWKSNVLLTAHLCPGIVFAVFFVMNLILWAEQSSAAIPFGTLVMRLETVSLEHG